MQITFELKGGLTANLPSGVVRLKNNGGWTVAGLIKWLDIPPDEMGNAVLNGKMAGGKTPLKDGDTVIFYPAIGGG